VSLAERIADELADMPGVEAVVLGGSRASGRRDAHSDVDLGIYYAPGEPPSQAALARVATSLQGGAPATLAAPGEWGPWMNGGGWLVVDGTSVDWILRDLGRVSATFDACLSGTVTCDYYLGHPHGFHNHYYLAEVHHAVPLYDRNATLEVLKGRLTPYPTVLRQALIEKYLYDAGFMLDLARKSAPRADVLHVVGCLFRAAADLVQVMFALNEQFTMNEKQSLAATESFAIQPRAFAQRVTNILAAPGGDSTTLATSIDETTRLIAETCAEAPPLAYSWTSRVGEKAESE
jgi:hypothetical protein